MTSTRGPRRTRLYDASYNIGERYYKSALDKLDRKYSGRPDPSESSAPMPTRLRFNLDDEVDNDLQAARARAHRAITEEPVYDSRGRRTVAGLPLSSAFEDDIDDDVQATLNRIRANRPKASSLMRELNMDDSISKTNRRVNMDLGEKLLDMGGEDDTGSSIRSRAFKMISRTAADEEPVTASAKSVVSFKRATIMADSSDTASSSASLRANATKARLADIESEMSSRSEKMLQREKRAANLKKLLADSDI